MSEAGVSPTAPWCFWAVLMPRPGLSRPHFPAMLTLPLSPPSRKMATNFLAHEKIWFDKFKYDDAERRFYEQMNGPVAGASRQVRAARGAALLPDRSGRGTQSGFSQARKAEAPWPSGSAVGAGSGVSGQAALARPPGRVCSGPSCQRLCTRCGARPGTPSPADMGAFACRHSLRHLPLFWPAELSFCAVFSCCLCEGSWGFLVCFLIKFFFNNKKKRLVLSALSAGERRQRDPP